MHQDYPPRYLQCHSPSQRFPPSTRYTNRYQEWDLYYLHLERVPLESQVIA